jgi:hypothetical protein
MSDYDTDILRWSEPSGGRGTGRQSKIARNGVVCVLATEAANVY